MIDYRLAVLLIVFVLFGLGVATLDASDRSKEKTVNGTDIEVVKYKNMTCFYMVGNSVDCEPTENVRRNSSGGEAVESVVTETEVLPE